MTKARVRYEKIVRLTKMFEAYAADPDAKLPFKSLSGDSIPGHSIRRISLGAKHANRLRAVVEIEGVSLEGKHGVFDPHYLPAMLLADLVGVRFVPDNRVKPNAQASASLRKIKFRTTILMAAPEECPITARFPLLRFIADTPPDHHTTRGPALEDHRRLTLTISNQTMRDKQVPIVAPSTRTREDAIDFIVDVACWRKGFSDVLPDIGITLEEFEHQLRRSLRVADAVHAKLAKRMEQNDAA